MASLGFTSPLRVEPGSSVMLSENRRPLTPPRSSPYLFEVAAAPLLPVHHVVEDRDHDVAQVWLRDQGHLQEGADQGRDEMELVFSCIE